MLALLFCGGLVAGVPHEGHAQEVTGPCADTLEAADKAYRNRNYQKAVELASRCTGRTVRRETAIRAHRLVTLASLRQGNLLKARSAVNSILELDPTYTTDPVNDPPAYETFVSMVRQGGDTGGPAEAEAGKPEEEEADTSESTSTLQPDRTGDNYFVKPLGIGFSDYTGDMPAQNVGHPFDFQEFRRGSGFPFVVHGEFGYQFTPSWAFVLGFQAGNYPIVGFNTGEGSISDSWRYTPQLMARYTFGTLGHSVAYYLDGGFNVTFGGDGIAKPGFGPSLGGGVDIPLNRSLSFFVESRFNFTLPDDAIDGSDASSTASGGPFDLVNQLLGVGLRIRFGDRSIDRLPVE